MAEPTFGATWPLSLVTSIGIAMPIAYLVISKPGFIAIGIEYLMSIPRLSTGEGQG